MLHLAMAFEDFPVYCRERGYLAPSVWKENPSQMSRIEKRFLAHLAQVFVGSNLSIILESCSWVVSSRIEREVVRILHWVFWSYFLSQRLRNMICCSLLVRTTCWDPSLSKPSFPVTPSNAPSEARWTFVVTLCMESDDYQETRIMQHAILLW